MCAARRVVVLCSAATPFVDATTTCKIEASEKIASANHKVAPWKEERIRTFVKPTDKDTRNPGT